MANTYSCLHVQLVFAVYRRENLIPENRRIAIQKYMTAVAQAHEIKVLAIYCNPDHVHILVGVKPDMSVSTVAKTIKAKTSYWINKMGWFTNPFRWQRGYGAFCYSRWDTPRLIKYILNQKEHHRKIPFRDEYLELLEEQDIEYDHRYLFEWIDQE